MEDLEIIELKLIDLKHDFTCAINCAHDEAEEKTNKSIADTVGRISALLEIQEIDDTAKPIAIAVLAGLKKSFDAIVKEAKAEEPITDASADKANKFFLRSEKIREILKLI